ncbi:Os03g0264150 [Oryza sativa Japonica Group]|uniref:Os03g0264150 protein n=1 Tax=Oryza sativa subsp. japonica TaxID=39947 RepID=A0A0P0VVQ7_ORYSJ|nr:hypothetical protein EE612_016648 [Oryza sativa]BAS83389.1 Os03g0264150 [Oryza sativa Japonica Group]
MDGLCWDVAWVHTSATLMKRSISSSGYSSSSGSTISKSLPCSRSFHVHSTRTFISCPQVDLLLLSPLITSRTRTPKLYISAFLVNCPNKAYSGAK